MKVLATDKDGYAVEFHVQTENEARAICALNNWKLEGYSGKYR